MKILIVKTSSLGDIIHCFPVIAYLREKFPTSQIDWVAEKGCQELLTRNPEIRNVHEINTKKWRKEIFSKTTRLEFRQFKKNLKTHTYDVVFDLQGNCKSGLITFLANGKKKIGFGAKTVPEWPNLLATKNRYNPPPNINIRNAYLHLVQTFFQDFQEPKTFSILLHISDEESSQIQSLLQKSNGKKNVVICPGSIWKNKMLPTKTLEQLMEHLPENPYFFLLWGNEYEAKIADALHQAFPNRSFIMPKLSLACLQNFFSKVDQVVSMDSLPLHLAGTTNTETLSFFGPSLANVYKPIGKQHSHIQGQCPYGLLFEKRCPKLRTCSTGACQRTLHL